MSDINECPKCKLSLSDCTCCFNNADNKDASAWIEQVLLPDLENRIASTIPDATDKGYEYGYNEACKKIRNIILSHRDEWKGK